MKSDCDNKQDAQSTMSSMLYQSIDGLQSNYYFSMHQSVKEVYEVMINMYPHSLLIEAVELVFDYLRQLYPDIKFNDKWTDIIIVNVDKDGSSVNKGQQLQMDQKLADLNTNYFSITPKKYTKSKVMEFLKKPIRDIKQPNSTVPKINSCQQQWYDALPGTLCK